jgi:enoyl-CoA hydratase
MTEYQFWLTKIEEDVLWIILNRPDKKNAFNEQVIREFADIIQTQTQDPALRAVVITASSDKIFCAGADIPWFIDITAKSATEISVYAHGILNYMESLPIPVIAVVKGMNLTAGFELTLACDIILAADNAKFGLIENQHGLTPGWGGTQRLTRLVGPQKAKEMIFTAKLVDAQEALRIGLVSQVYPLAEIDEAVKKFLGLIKRSSGRAIKEAKMLIQHATYINHQGFQQESKVFGENFASGEPQQRLSKFVEKQGKIQ